MLEELGCQNTVDIYKYLFSWDGAVSRSGPILRFDLMLGQTFCNLPFSQCNLCFAHVRQSTKSGREVQKCGGNHLGQRKEGKNKNNLEKIMFSHT